MVARLRALLARRATTDARLAAFIQRVSRRVFVNTVRRRVRGRDNVISTRGALLSDVSVRIDGDHNRIIIGERSFLRKVTIVVRGDGHTIRIGSDVVFSEGGTLWFEDHGGTLRIGDHSTFVSADFSVTEPGSTITVGSDCLFAYDVDVRTGDSHSVLDAATGVRINHPRDVQIDDHVWVGVGARLLKGACISRDSVVGADAVVTTAFTEANVAIAGNPARAIRHGVTWSSERV